MARIPLQSQAGRHAQSRPTQPAPKALGPDLDRVAATSLDKGVELDALATMLVSERTGDLPDYCLTKLTKPRCG
jgi:hypothetical protein